MAKVPDHLLYTEEHEFVHKSDVDDVVEIGITDYAQSQLGDVVYVDLPKIGSKYAKMEPFGTIEAVKAVSELFCPVAGEVVEVNAELAGQPERLNSDPHGAAWMIRLKVSDPGEAAGLMDAAAYSALVAAEEK